MSETLIDCGNGFWNIRGSFKLGGLVELGTQASLVRLADGRFVMLDSYSLSPGTLARIAEITGGPDRLDVIVNLHPFHSLHVEAMARAFPDAALFGTARHRRLFPALNWQETGSEEPETWARFAPDLLFSCPAGVQLIPQNERIHCGSVLAFHPASGTIHVDDTFNYRPARSPGTDGRLSVHPTLRFALEKRPGAAAAFRDWGAGLVRDWAGAVRLCAAHSGVLSPADPGGTPLPEAMAAALARSEKVLTRHARKYG